MYLFTRETHSYIREELTQDNLFQISYNKIMRTPLLTSSSVVIPLQGIKPGKTEKALTIGELEFLNPKAYNGIYAFHKYWGKKPMETYSYLIDNLTNEGETVCDPFIGSGVAALESVMQKRKFIGGDINPIAINLSKMLLNPPAQSILENELLRIKIAIKDKILESYYIPSTGQCASHYLWDKDILRSIWYKGVNARKKHEVAPSQDDLKVGEIYKDYKCRILNNGVFFKNSRINSTENMGIHSLFTGRALRNIELILTEIELSPKEVQLPLKLCLTAGSGQMSNMVFAITGRGKTKGLISNRIEVGSWVIGYWKPGLHFEINVWNTFEARVFKLVKAIQELINPNKIKISETLLNSKTRHNEIVLKKSDALTLLESLPAESINAIITDPPHSDRIPYLELSEIWNTILDEKSDFKNELVVSNAKAREKTKEQYSVYMEKLFVEAKRVLSKDGVFALMFNARDNTSWNFYNRIIEQPCHLRYRGYIKVNYSANSVVQDNRDGSLDDLILFFDKSNSSTNSSRLATIMSMQTWNSQSPKGNL